MSKIKMVEPLVKTILEEVPFARNDDFYLVAEVYNRLNNEVRDLKFNIVMLAHKELKLPPPETITRSRRKLQAKYEHLRAKEKIEEFRTNEEVEFRRYALEK